MGVPPHPPPTLPEIRSGAGLASGSVRSGGRNLRKAVGKSIGCGRQAGSRCCLPCPAPGFSGGAHEALSSDDRGRRTAGSTEPIGRQRDAKIGVHGVAGLTAAAKARASM